MKKHCKATVLGVVVGLVILAVVSGAYLEQTDIFQETT